MEDNKEELTVLRREQLVDNMHNVWLKQEK